MKKIVIINTRNFEFFFDERLNMWRLIENSLIIENEVVDLEINLSILDSDLDWTDIENFLKSFRLDKHIVSKNINDAKSVLKHLFSIINKDAFSNDFLDEIDFKLVGIDYKGKSNNVNLKNEFVYDFFFFPYNIKNNYADVGSFVW